MKPRQYIKDLGSYICFCIRAKRLFLTDSTMNAIWVILLLFLKGEFIKNSYSLDFFCLVYSVTYPGMEYLSNCNLHAEWGARSEKSCTGTSFNRSRSSSCRKRTNWCRNLVRPNCSWNIVESEIGKTACQSPPPYIIRGLILHVSKWSISISAYCYHLFLSSSSSIFYDTKIMLIWMFF